MHGPWHMPNGHPDELYDDDDGEDEARRIEDESYEAMINDHEPIAALSPPAAEGREDTCGILPPRHDPLCVSASPCLLPDGHDGPHACETRDGRRSWQSDDDCDCCDVTDPDRCITWSPSPAAEPVEISRAEIETAYSDAFDAKADDGFGRFEAHKAGLDAILSKLSGKAS